MSVARIALYFNIFIKAFLSDTVSKALSGNMNQDVVVKVNLIIFAPDLFFMQLLIIITRPGYFFFAILYNILSLGMVTCNNDII